MPDESKLRHELDRAVLAKQIMDNPLWVEAWDAVRDRCLSTWEGGTTPEQREEAWQTLRVAKKVRRAFEQVIQTGQLAERQLEELNNG